MYTPILNFLDVLINLGGQINRGVETTAGSENANMGLQEISDFTPGISDIL